MGKQKEVSSVGFRIVARLTNTGVSETDGIHIYQQMQWNEKTTLGFYFCLPFRGRIHTQIATRNVNLTFILIYTHPPLKTSTVATNVQALLSPIARYYIYLVSEQLKCVLLMIEAVNVEKCQTATDKTSKNKTHPPTYVKLTFLVAIWVPLRPREVTPEFSITQKIETHAANFHYSLFCTTSYFIWAMPYTFVA